MQRSFVGGAPQPRQQRAGRGARPYELKIYNILGQLVRTLVDEEMMPGNYQVVWNGKDDGGKEVASGIYFYQLAAGNKKITKKMVLVR